MELSKIETGVVEAAIAEAAIDQLRELNNLQLALVGGGMGESSFV